MAEFTIAKTFDLETGMVDGVFSGVVYEGQSSGTVSAATFTLNGATNTEGLAPRLLALFFERQTERLRPGFDDRQVLWTQEFTAADYGNPRTLAPRFGLPGYESVLDVEFVLVEGLVAQLGSIDVTLTVNHDQQEMTYGTLE